MIQLRFSTTRSFIPSALIRWRTQSAVSHVEFFNPGCGVTLGARWSLTEIDNGVRLRGAAAIADQEGVVLATFPGIEQAYEHGLALIGTPYNLKGIFGIAAARDWTSKHHLDCSNFIFEAARMAGVLLLNPEEIAPWKITPRDLMLSPKVTIL